MREDACIERVAQLGHVNASKMRVSALGDMRTVGWDCGCGEGK